MDLRGETPIYACPYRRRHLSLPLGRPHRETAPTPDEVSPVIPQASSATTPRPNCALGPRLAEPSPFLPTVGAGRLRVVRPVGPKRFLNFYVLLFDFLPFFFPLSLPDDREGGFANSWSIGFLFFVLARFTVFCEVDFSPRYLNREARSNEI